MIQSGTNFQSVVSGRPGNMSQSSYITHYRQTDKPKQMEKIALENFH